MSNEAKEIIDTNGIRGKIPKLEEKQAFITIKDHKSDFPRNIKCRLINPSKTHLAKVSKKILDNYNACIRSKTSVLQWRRTKDVIEWFKNIKNKSVKYFVRYRELLSQH